MALIQNEDNKCPTTKQVNDALNMKSDEFEVTIGNLREYQE